MEKKQDKLEDIENKPQGFVMAILGTPGSGKTTLIKKYITEKAAGNYDYILIISPSSAAYETLVPKSQLSTSFTITWVYKMINMINTASQGKKQRVLLIMDDCIGEVKAKALDPKIVSLFFNRRHLLWNDSILSYIITSQKYKMVPSNIRVCLTDMILFNLSPIDAEKIFEELIMRYSRKTWKGLIQQLFDTPFDFIRFDISRQRIM